LVNSESTAILTREFREKLATKRLAPNDKWNWLDLNEGRLPPKILELPEDLLCIVYSPHSWELLENSLIRKSLLNVVAVLSEVLSGSFSVPIWRIVVKRKAGKRIFFVQEFEPLLWKRDFFSTHFVESEPTKFNKLKNHFNDLRTDYISNKIRKGSGLRSNEWKLVKTFYKANMKFAPFHLPLKRDQDYTWTVIKKELAKGLSQRMKISKELGPQTLKQKINSEIRLDIQQARKKAFKYGYDVSIRLWKPG